MSTDQRLVLAPRRMRGRPGGILFPVIPPRSARESSQTRRTPTRASLRTRPLTDRELEVLHLADELCNAAVAERLFQQQGTVNTHANRVSATSFLKRECQ